MEYEIVHVSMGEPLYEQVFARLRDDDELNTWMWSDAESRWDEDPAKAWWMAIHWDADGEPVALAWCAALLMWRDGQPMVKGCNNYDRRGYRHLELYPLVFAARHEAIKHLPGETFIFPEPVQLHLEHGWRVETGPGDSGWSDEPDAPSHFWQRLTYTPRG